MVQLQLTYILHFQPLIKTCVAMSKILSCLETHVAWQQEGHLTIEMTILLNSV